MSFIYIVLQIVLVNAQQIAGYKFFDLATARVLNADDNYGYSSKYDIPQSVANYTDNRNVTHPLWAKPFFDKEYKSFDDVWNAPSGTPSGTVPTNQQLYDQFKVAATCL